MSSNHGGEWDNHPPLRTTAAWAASAATIDFPALFESAPDAYLVLSPDLTILAANRQRSVVTMIAGQDIVGRPLFEVFPDNPDDVDANGVSNLRASLQRVIDTGLPDRMPRQKYDIRRPIDLGGEFEVRYWSSLNSPVPWPDGTLRYIVHRVEDITPTVLVEEQALAQRQLAATLAGAVRERTSELVEANAQLQRANDAKNDFLSRISHELRTPLNAILGFGQLLQMDNLGADHRASVDQIIKAGGHLLELIDEVLDISRVESGSLRLSLEPVNVHEIVADTVAMIEPMAAARGIALQNDLPPGVDLHVHADRQRFRQVLVNLVANAVKYNRENGMVRISQDLIEDVVRISVADTGVGIPIHGIPCLFQPFERLDADHTTVQGTGLGLALTKSLVEAMRGEIGVTSTYGTGTTFWVDFALTQPAAIDEAVLDIALEAIGRAGVRTPDKTVLYVEDNLSNVRLVERVMERRPEVNLIVAMQGRLAFDLAVEHKPSLVLLDLHLPDIGGEDVLRLLRSDPRTATIPVIILSADATPTQIRGLHALGANDYLTKPFDIPRLLSLVDGNSTDGAVADDDVNHPLDRSTVTTLHHLLAGQMGVRENFAQLIELFAADCVDHLRELREAVLAGDAGRVERFAHRLSGSSGNLGARIVARLCRELEQMGTSGDLAAAPGVLHRLEEACASATSALRAEVDVTSRL